MNKVILRLTALTTGATTTRQVHDGPDWSVLVNRLITKRFGKAAARNRQDISSTEFPVRHWTGNIDGHIYSIIEQVEPDQP